MRRGPASMQGLRGRFLEAASHYRGSISEAIKASGGLNLPAAQPRRENGLDGLQLLGRVYSEVNLGGPDL